MSAFRCDNVKGDGFEIYTRDAVIIVQFPQGNII